MCKILQNHNFSCRLALCHKHACEALVTPSVAARFASRLGCQFTFTYIHCYESIMKLRSVMDHPPFYREGGITIPVITDPQCSIVDLSGRGGGTVLSYVEVHVGVTCSALLLACPTGAVLSYVETFQTFGRSTNEKTQTRSCYLACHPPSGQVQC